MKRNPSSASSSSSSSLDGRCNGGGGRSIGRGKGDQVHCHPLFLSFPFSSFSHPNPKEIGSKGQAMVSKPLSTREEENHQYP